MSEPPADHPDHLTGEDDLVKRSSLAEPKWIGPTRSPLGIGDVYRCGNVVAIVSEHGPTGKHISVSAPSRYPTWDEISSIKQMIWPDARMAMILPPTSEYVNLHDTCLHVWEIAGEGA